MAILVDTRDGVYRTTAVSVEDVKHVLGSVDIPRTLSCLILRGSERVRLQNTYIPRRRNSK